MSVTYDRSVVFSTNIKCLVDLILALSSYHFGPIFALKQVPMDSILVPNSYPVNPIFSLKIYLWVHFYSINDSYPMYPIIALKNAVFKSNMASITGHRTHLMGGITRIIWNTIDWIKTIFTWMINGSSLTKFVFWMFFRNSKWPLILDLF